MIKISTNSRRMTTETEQKVRGRSIEFVTSLHRCIVEAVARSEFRVYAAARR
jgi:hypothetical protein